MELESTKNLNNLKKIDDYNETHTSDYKQVFFRPNLQNIKSERVGVYTKDIYNKDSVVPIKEFAGLHTADSCKLNTAVYANTKIDYNSPLKYKPGLRYFTVIGDFAGSVNYFLTATVVKDEKTTPEQYVDVKGDISVEITGYIAAERPGNYKVLSETTPALKHVFIWVGNNASKTYRAENAIYKVDNYVLKTNAGVKLVTGEYVPFRMQYTCKPGESGLSVLNLLASSDDKTPIRVFVMNESDASLYYYSLTPESSDGLYNKCSVYSGSDLQVNNNTTNSLQPRLVWSADIPSETAYVSLDITGNLCAYNSQNEKIATIFQIPDINPMIKYQLVLDENSGKPFFVRNTKSNIFPITSTTEIVAGVPNDRLKTTTRYKISPLSTDDKITEDNPLFSENFVYKVAIMKNAVGSKMLALLTSFEDNRVFYTAEADLKMNKLFYASTFVEHQFLKEVPEQLKAYGSTTSSYKEMYPDPDREYEITDCKEVCKACDHFYKVSDNKCLIPTTNEPILFLPKQPNSQYETSELFIKNKVIKTRDEEKDKIYDSTTYNSDGYASARFSRYPIENTMLSKDDLPGPQGMPYVSELQNMVERSTFGVQKKYNTIISNPMFAGKIEGFSIQENNRRLVADISLNLKTYAGYQKQIGINRTDIGGKINNINALYTDMSNNNMKYDFTSKDENGKAILYSLGEEDRSLNAALIKDNAVYLSEQNNLYLIGTITMATLLITAVLISK